jgi:transcriptional antiterminator RfaH
MKNIPPVGLSQAVDCPHWYAIYTRSRFEKKLFQKLQQAKYTVFLPLLKERKAWSDRIKSVLVPLLPSYVFIRAAPRDLTSVFYFPGVVRLVSCEGKPCIIRDEEITLLENIVMHGRHVCAITPCEIGDSVRIMCGPFKGWEGTVENKKGQARIVFQIASIRQCISVEVSLADVEKV